MTRIHGLKHIKGFFPTALADNDSIRTHSERVLHQFALPISPFLRCWVVAFPYVPHG